MAVAYDNTSSIGPTTGDQSWSHGGSASAAGALVLIVEEGGTDTITGVTYGSVAMDEVPLSPIHYTTPETGSIHGFFLNDPPTGTQDVAVDTATGSDQWIGACFTVTSATGYSEIHDTSTMAGAAAQTTVGATLTISKDSFVAGAMYSGLGSPAFTEVSGTTQVVEGDLGNDSGGISRGTTIKTTDFSYTWTQASDDGMALVVAIAERVQTNANAGAASGSGAANADTAKVSTLGAGSSATGAANAGSGNVGATEQAAAAATAAALDATAEVDEGQVTFDADLATAAGAALAIHGHISASSGYARARSVI